MSATVWVLYVLRNALLTPNKESSSHRTQVDRIFQSASSSRPKPVHHTIIEAHPQVLEHMRNQGVDKLPGVRILEGRWQDWLLDPEKIGQVLEGTPDSAGFDAIFVDTFAEGYEGTSHMT